MDKRRRLRGFVSAGLNLFSKGNMERLQVCVGTELDALY